MNRFDERSSPPPFRAESAVGNGDFIMVRYILSAEVVMGAIGIG